MTRDEAIEAIMSTGKDREQAEAFLAILGSAFARRGWATGVPLSAEAIDENARVLFGAREPEATLAGDRRDQHAARRDVPGTDPTDRHHPTEETRNA